MSLSFKHYTNAELKRFIMKTKLPTLVHTMAQVSEEDAIYLFNELPARRAETVFIYQDPSLQVAILNAISTERAVEVLERMEPDDRARLLEELPEEKATFYLDQLSRKERQATILLLKYSEESAGRIMSPFFVPLTVDQTVTEALTTIRQHATEAETVNILPVLDEQKHLLGVVTLEHLVLGDSEDKVGALMSTDATAFSVHDDQETVARFIQDTDRLAVPIIDDLNRVVGIVTMDDAMDVLQMEETEDMSLAGAVEPLGKPYFAVSVMRLMRVRVVWLMFLAIAGTLTVNVLDLFSHTLDKDTVLALFIPLLIGIGGNTGSQSATTIVRALAVDHVSIRDFFRIAIRETAVGFLLGLALGVCGFVILQWFFPVSIAMIVSVSLAIICTIAALTGSTMPLLARLLSLDPAVVSAPFVSTIIDASGLMIYFIVAKTILQS